MEASMIIKALECFHQRILDTDLAENIYEAEIMAIIDALSLIDELNEENEKLTSIGISKDIIIESVNDVIVKLNEENDRLSTALAEYEYKTNIRISEEYVPYDDYEELREENKKLIEEAENYKKVAEKQQSISMERHFEIKRLKEENDKLAIECDSLQYDLDLLKQEKSVVVADTVKKYKRG